MILAKIWQRYFLKELLKVFALFLFVFFFLYAVMDYSTHMQDFIKGKKIQVSDLLIYYSYQFIKRALLLIPLALLVATIKVLCTLNIHRELVALQASGLKLKTLLRPFFFVATCCVIFNYASQEFLLPKALNFTDQFHNSHFRHSHWGERKERMQVINLKDDTKLAYQNYDKAKGVFFDVFWVRSAEDIWRIKYLKPDTTNPVGYYVDHLQRNKEGLFEKTESFDTYTFSQIKYKRSNFDQGIVPLENRSLSNLYKLLSPKDGSPTLKPEVLTQFGFKAIMPLLSLLVVVGAAPYCVGYSRQLPVFFIYAIALFGFISFFTLMDAAVILGENQVVSPLWAVFGPFFICFAIFFRKFARTH